MYIALSPIIYSLRSPYLAVKVRRIISQTQQIFAYRALVKNSSVDDFSTVFFCQTSVRLVSAFPPKPIQLIWEFTVLCGRARDCNDQSWPHHCPKTTQTLRWLQGATGREQSPTALHHYPINQTIHPYPTVHCPDLGDNPLRTKLDKMHASLAYMLALFLYYEKRHIAVYFIPCKSVCQRYWRTLKT